MGWWSLLHHTDSWHIRLKAEPASLVFFFNPDVVGVGRKKTEAEEKI